MEPSTDDLKILKPREVMILLHTLGLARGPRLTPAMIAEKLGTSEIMIRRHMSRAYMRLAGKLKPMGSKRTAKLLRELT